MASLEGRTVTTNLLDRENLVAGKKAENSKFKVPIRRPALVDLGNKIANQSKNQTETYKLKSNEKQLYAEKQHDEHNKNNICNRVINVTSASSKTTGPISKKVLRREESLLNVSSAYSSKQLHIYDPDENTRNDPNAVTEYLEDIFSHLRDMETKHAIEKDFLQNHKTTISMREILVSWIAELQVSLKLCIETYHLCISLIDRYLQVNKSIGSSNLQLVGVTALMIACKYEEIFLPEIGDFVYVCDDSFTAKQILKMEREILTALNFVLGRPTSIHFLRRYSKIARVTAVQHSLGKYLIELATLEYSICHIPPSYIAAAACCLSMAILNEEMDLTKVWNPTLIYYTTYELADFRSVIVSLAKILIKIESSKLQAIRKKYAAASCGKVSSNVKLRGPLVKKLAAEKDRTIVM